MNILAAFKAKPAPARQPGRHSVAWAAMQQGLVELRQRADGFETRVTELLAERDETERRHVREHRAQTETFDTERQGWRDALDHASREYADLMQRHRYERERADGLEGEIGRLRVALADEAAQRQRVLQMAEDRRVSHLKPPMPDEAATQRLPVLPLGQRSQPIRLPDGFTPLIQVSLDAGHNAYKSVAAVVGGDL
jgi:hypothetical protein